MKQFLLLLSYINIRITVMALFLISMLFSCKKYLDAKPDKKIVIATTLQDAQALLDNYTIFNSYYPCIGDQSDDNFFLDDNRFNSLDLAGRSNYTWAKEAINESDWGEMYQIVLNATIALETVEKIPEIPSNRQLLNTTKGGALFYRGYALFQLAEYYSDIYDSITAPQKPGIPLRTSSDATIRSTRSSLAETWEHIADNFRQAAALLPVSSTIPSRPTKAAAWAALARTYLIMDRFELAVIAADSSLKLQNTLLDFNTLDSTASDPFTMFNTEVIFPSTSNTASQLDKSTYSLDSNLYTSYVPEDLRRSMYFSLNDYGGYGFKASYDGDNFNGSFNGIGVDEVLLIRAECFARTGHIDEAMNDLNTLLVTRWKRGTYIPLTAANSIEAIQLILKERRKELILRGTRWFDLRRLSKEHDFAIQPERIVNGSDYILPPNSSRYTFLIPKQVIDLTGMKQNTR